MRIRTLLTAVLLVAASFTAAFTAGTIAAQPASASAAAVSHVTVTPEAAACTAAYHFHHVNAVRYVSTEAAWDHVWHVAGAADPGLRHAVRYWLTWGRGWSVVACLCRSGR